ncbi:hypothetical protein QQ045_027714 [Rhodiola kirilowii]
MTNCWSTTKYRHTRLNKNSPAASCDNFSPARPQQRKEHFCNLHLSLGLHNLMWLHMYSSVHQLSAKESTPTQLNIRQTKDLKTKKTLQILAEKYDNNVRQYKLSYKTYDNYTIIDTTIKYHAASI